MASPPFLAEKNLQLVVQEAQIRRQTGRSPSKMYHATTVDIISWKAHHQEKLSFKDPIDNAPDASVISYNCAKGLELLDHWIGLHVDEATGMPLVFTIRLAQPHDSPFLPSNYLSLFEFAKRGRMQDRKGIDYEWAATIRIKVWNIVYGIFQDHPAYQYIRQFKRSKDGPAAQYSPALPWSKQRQHHGYVPGCRIRHSELHC
jgi:hypothetical protein